MKRVYLKVFFSIKPRYVQAILDGNKNVELRKKHAMIREPFTALLYETQKGGGMGRVVGEATVKCVSYLPSVNGSYQIPESWKTGLTEAELVEYGRNKRRKDWLDDLWGYELTDIVKYEQPRPVKDFISGFAYRDQIWVCKKDVVGHFHTEQQTQRFLDIVALNNPPQSFCYVWDRKELEELIKEQEGETK